ncbi:hypothetical protein HF086_003310 [Spodoptera exigua]|uniref:Uncharacterized protein n=1 Tax=Spodoptera exigua TaxID=7107 RepID=A0A922MXC7_SPOEX|nr:hypothetical protein HF086_003310 [Spodoptera exigua]
MSSHKGYNRIDQARATSSACKHDTMPADSSAAAHYCSDSPGAISLTSYHPNSPRPASCLLNIAARALLRVVSKHLTQIFHKGLFINRPRSNSYSGISSEAPVTNTQTLEALYVENAHKNDQNDTQNWQKENSRKRLRSSPETTSRTQKQTKLSYWLAAPVPTSNMFAELAIPEETKAADQVTRHIEKPPPFFVDKVSNIQPLSKMLEDVAHEDYEIKILQGERVKIQAKSPESYSTIYKELKSRNTEFFTYQPKGEKNFRVVLKHMHPSTDTEEIKQALEELHHKPNNEAFGAPIALQTENDIVNAIEFFTTSIQSAAWNSTPIVQHKPAEQYVPPSILDKIREKRNLRKLWQQNRCPDTKKHLNHKIKELKDILDQHRNAGLQAYLEDLDATSATDYSLWKATKNLKRPVTTSPPLRKADNCWARSDQEKAYVFAEHLSNVFQPHPYEGPVEHEKTKTEANIHIEACLPDGVGNNIK